MTIEEKIAILEARIIKLEQEKAEYDTANRTFINETLKDIPNNQTEDDLLIPDDTEDGSDDKAFIINIEAEEIKGKNSLKSKLQTILFYILGFIGVIATIFIMVYICAISGSDNVFILFFIISSLSLLISIFFSKISNNTISRFILLYCSVISYATIVFLPFFSFSDNILIPVIYILFLIWAMVMRYCSKYKKYVFCIIGQGGVLFSIALYMLASVVDNELTNLVLLFIYGVAVEVLYSIISDKSAHAINSIAAFIVSYILTYPTMKYFEKNIMGSFWPYNVQDLTLYEVVSRGIPRLSMFLLAAGLFLYIVFRNIKMFYQDKIGEIQYFIVTIAGTITCALMMSRLKWTMESGVVVFLLCIIIFGINEYMYIDKERTLLSTILSCIYIVFIVAAYHFTFRPACLSSMIFIAFFAFYALINSEDCPKAVFYTGVIATTVANIIYSFFNTVEIKDRFPWENLIFYISILISISIITWMYKKYTDETDITKICVYLFIVFNVVMPLVGFSGMHKNVDDVFAYKYKTIANLWMFLSVLIIQIFYKYNGFFNENEDIFKQPAFLCYFAVNANYMAMAMVENFTNEGYKNDLIIFSGISIIALMLFSLNTMNLLKEHKIKPFIYVMIKYEVFIFCTMHVIASKSSTIALMAMWAVTGLGFKGWSIIKNKTQETT